MSNLFLWLSFCCFEAQAESVVLGQVSFLIDSSQAIFTLDLVQDDLFSSLFTSLGRPYSCPRRCLKKKSRNHNLQLDVEVNPSGTLFNHVTHVKAYTCTSKIIWTVFIIFNPKDFHTLLRPGDQFSCGVQS